MTSKDKLIEFLNSTQTVYVEINNKSEICIQVYSSNDIDFVFNLDGSLIYIA